MQCSKQSLLGISEEVIGGQCDWSEVNEGGMSSER